MIDVLHKQADELTLRVQRLAEKADQLSQSNQKLKEEAAQLREEIKQRNTLVKELEAKLKTSAVVQNIQTTTPEQVKELKQKLTEYIKEIDRTIAKLNTI
jgi:methyl-accepting chemotaxis protein